MMGQEHHMSKRYYSGFLGVYFREHPTRKVAPKSRTKDKYLILRFRKNGKTTDQGLGWLSEGWTFEEAAQILKILKKNIKLGEGPQSIKELKEENAQQQEVIRKQKQDHIAEEQAANILVRDAAEAYLKWATDSKLQQSTLKAYKAAINNHILPHLETLPIRSLTYSVLAEFREKLVNKKSQRKSFNSQSRKKLAESTIDEVLGRLRSIVYYCKVTPVSDDYPNRMMFQGENPLVPNRYSGANLFFKPKSGNKRILGDEEFDAIFEASLRYSQRQYDATRIGLDTGMRISEIVVMRIEDLRDIQKQIIYIPKGKTGPRTIRIPAKLIPILERRMLMQNKSRWLFPGNGALGHVSTKTISTTFTEICRELEINKHIADNQSKATFHTLRSMCAVNMLVAKFDIAIVSGHLGHSDVRITMNSYLPIAEMLLQTGAGIDSKYNAYLSFNER